MAVPPTKVPRCNETADGMVPCYRPGYPFNCPKIEHDKGTQSAQLTFPWQSLLQTHALICGVLWGCSATPSADLPSAKAAKPAAVPHAAVVANVTLVNKVSSHWVYAYVDYSYNGNPIWINEAKTCVAPGANWKTSITYNHPDRGPQIRIRTDAYGKDCSGVFPKLQREVSYKDFAFDKGETTFDAGYAYYSRSGYVLCVSQSGSHEVIRAYQ